MKMLKTAFFLFSLLNFMNLVWAASPITLKARSGEQISIGYEFSDSWATGVRVTVDRAMPGMTRVVLINSCESNVSYFNRSEVYDCGYGADGSLLTSGSCIRAVTQQDTEPSMSFPFGKLQVGLISRGMMVKCYQQIAVSLEPNQWLVDPVSGEHNFNFRF